MSDSGAIIRPLHGLRGIAALMVVVGHSGQVTSLFAAAPSLGVLIFFALSGFLMGHLYLAEPFRTEIVWRYAVARVARVYPLFATVVVIAAALSLVVFDGSQPFGFSVDQLVPHLLFAGSAATVWTISVEFQFYAAFLIIWLIYYRLTRIADTMIVLCCLAAASVCWISAPWSGRVDLPRYFPVFALGVTGSVIVRHIPRLLHSLSGVAMAGSLVFLACVYFGQWGPDDREMIYGDITIVGVGTILVVCAAAVPLSIAGKILGSLPLVWLGEISFAVYLLHRIVIFALYQLGAADWPPQLAFGAILLVTLLAASATHKWFELPTRRAVRLAGERMLRLINSVRSQRS